MTFKENKVATITGHRPNRIRSLQLVAAQLHNAFVDLNVTHVIQGMASGVDLEAAREAYRKGIDYSCAVPWEGWEPRMNDADLTQKVLDHAKYVWVVNDALGYPGPWVYQERNEFMVDRSHIVIAVWDGVKNGGTWNCIKYAHGKGLPIWRIDPADGASDWYAPEITFI